jgi:hypothetical protein
LEQPPPAFAFTRGALDCQCASIAGQLAVYRREDNRGVWLKPDLPNN